jgi:hypothetical protein
MEMIIRRSLTPLNSSRTMGSVRRRRRLAQESAECPWGQLGIEFANGVSFVLQRLFDDHTRIAIQHRNRLLARM